MFLQLKLDIEAAAQWNISGMDNIWKLPGLVKESKKGDFHAVWNHATMDAEREGE